MRWTFCIKSLASKGGGAERVFVAVVNGLVERGCKVKVITYDHDQFASFYPLHEKVETLGLGIGKVTEKARLLETLQRIMCLRAVVRESQPDVVVGFMHSMYIPLGLALLGTGLPLIGSEHIVPEHYKTRPLQALLLKLSPFLCDKITAVSEQARAAYSKSIRQKMIAVSNPIYAPKKTDDNFIRSEKKKVVLGVGRLEDQKDFETLLLGFGQVASKFPQWTLRIVGDGSLRGKLESLIQRLGIEKQVELPGYTTEVFDEYRKASIFVMPSKYESFGLTLVEALSFQLPCIGFKDCLGVNLFIESGYNGVLVDPGSDRASNLARTLEKIISDSTLRDRLSVKFEVPKSMTTESVITTWHDIGNSLAPAS